MKRVLNLFLAVLLVCTVNGLGDLKAQSNNKVAQLEKLSAIENNPQKTIRKQTAAIRHSLKTAASAESVELFGCMTYSSKWSTSENGEFGIYSFPAEEGIAFTPVKTAADFNLSAAVYADGKFCGYRVTTYGSTVYGVNYYLFDTDGWTRDIQQTLKASYDNYPISLAYDSKTKTIYGQFMSEAGTTRLCTVDLLSGQPTQVASTGDRMYFTLSFDKEGTLYGIADDGNLYTINTATGTAASIGATGIMPSNSQSATIDLNTGKMYWAAINNKLQSALYEVNLDNGKASLVSDYDETVVLLGLYTVPPAAAPQAPAAVDKLSVNYTSPERLDANITFTAPDKTFEGDKLEGSLEVSIYVDHQKLTLENATVVAGAEFSTPYTFTEGTHKVEAFVSNAEGDGVKSKIEIYAGVDSPAAVGNLQFTLEDNHATVSWEAPVNGANGGHFDAELLKYILVRYPGNDTINAEYTATVFTEDLPDVLGNYYYTVTAVAEKVGVATESNRIRFGSAFKGEFKETFDHASALDIFTIIDANEDGKTWAWINNAAGSDQLDKNADDWIITPPIELGTDYLYKLSFKTKGYGEFYTESFSTAFGSENTVEGMLNALGDYTASGDTYLEKSSVIEVQEAGTYYFGFHHTSQGMYLLYIDDIVIEPFIPTTAPDSVTDFTAIPDPTGVLKAVLTFKAPTKAINGDELTTLSKIEILKEGNVILTENEVEKGKEYSFTVDGVQGMNHYNVIVYDEQGRGRDAEKSVFIGTDIPQHVQNLIASWDDENDQAALLTWDAPAETGANGGFINPEELTYNYGTYLFGSIIDMATGIKETSYLMTTAGLTKQTYTQGYICAVSAGGKGAYTPFGIMLGTPLAFPFAESFAQGNVSTETWSVATVGGDDTWGMYQNGGSLDAQDEDNGYAMLVNKKAEADDSRLESPIINIAGQDKLTLEFYLHTEDAELTVETTVNGTIYEAASEALRSDGSNEWTKVSLPLDQLAGNKRIQLGFRGKTEKAGARIAIDNITLTSGSTGIADNTADNSSIYSEGRNIILTGLNGVQVTVYSLDGKTITNASLHTDYEVIPMQHAGCYLVHTEKGVTKVLVK